MDVEEFDVIVLGLGPGGEDAAGQLAEAGLSVAGVEARLVGGECPYFACVPTKMMLRGADLIAEGRRIPGMAGKSSVEPDFAPVARRIRDEATTDWDDKIAVDRFTGKGGHFFRGRGRITAPAEITVDDGRVLRARTGIVIATGTEPAVPPVQGLEGTPYWTNRDAVQVETVPESLIVLGGGPVGVEFAQAFSRFGSRVTLVEGLDRLVPAEEPEAGDLLGRVLTDEGIEVHCCGKAATVDYTDGRFTLSFEGDGGVTGERLLVATGRRVNLAALGVGAIGIDESARALPVDEHLRVAPGVWALGDVTGKGAFTHMAVYQAGIVVRDILGSDGASAEYHAVPRVTFTDPEVGAVGLTEREAREQGMSVRTGIAQVPSTARGWIHKAGNDGFIKLVVADGVLVGATSVGPWGGEVLGMLALAVHVRIPVVRLRQMIYAYPTFHRGIEDALRSVTD